MKNSFTSAKSINWPVALLIILAIGFVVMSIFVYGVYSSYENQNEYEAGIQFQRQLRETAYQDSKFLSYEAREDRYIIPELQLAMPSDEILSNTQYVYEYDETNHFVYIRFGGSPSDRIPVYVVGQNDERPLCSHDYILSTAKIDKNSEVLVESPSRKIYISDFVANDCEKFINSRSGEELRMQLENAYLL